MGVDQYIGSGGYGSGGTSTRRITNTRYVPTSQKVPIWGGTAPADRVRIGVSSPSALANSPAYNYVTNNGRNQAGPGINNAAIQAAARGRALAGYAGNPNARAPAGPAFTGGAGSGGRGGGGGGGGGAAGLSQEMLDWLAGLLRGGAPAAQTATAVDLPDFTGTFDVAPYEQQRTAWNEAVGRDVGTAEQATQRALDFVRSNYQNAFTNPNNTYATAGQAPGMNQQAMARLLTGQGVDPSVMAAEAAARAGADQAFGNLWRSSAANEDIGQRNRLNTATLSGQDAIQRLREMGLAGTAGLNMAQTAAQSAFNQQAQERNWQTAQQEALANWTRANQVSDTNMENTTAYRNQVLQTLIGLLPELGGLALPDLAALGL